MPLAWVPYLDQLARWPTSGQQVHAQYDSTSVVVYQAYRPSIGRWAVEHGQFGGPGFSFSRMTWIKPNFLWMMYRSGWGTKAGQETTLAVHLRREFFDRLVTGAVPTSADVKPAGVLVQWDPDHDPTGSKVGRRAIQLGLRGEAMREYATSAIVAIEDISADVERERAHANDPDRLQTPREDPYPIGLPRTVEESLAAFGLVPADASLPAIRAMLAEEAMLERNGKERAEDLALLCCAQLFSRGLLEDVLRIWDAKRSGFDLDCYLDGEFLVGAGVEATIEYLAKTRGPAAAKALEYIRGMRRVRRPSSPATESRGA
jgi:Domain of unknown function (DUF4291)